MPVVFEKEMPGKYHLVIWKVTESYEELKQRTTAPKNRLTKYHDIKLDKRKTEWIGRSFLYDHLKISGLTYLENGKPVLEEEHISISHCDDLVGMIKATYPIGLDLQNPQPILERIANRYCNEEELRSANSSEDKRTSLSLIWSAKEVVFKIYGENMPYAEGMRVILGESLETAKCFLKMREPGKIIPLQIEKYRDYYFVYNEGF